MSIFLKRVFTSGPAQPRNNTTWNAPVVLNFLESWHPAGCLPLLNLSRNFIILLALLSGQRSQSLLLLDIRNLTCTQTRLYLGFGDVLKTPDQVLTRLRLLFQPFPTTLHCVMSNYIHYMDRTRSFKSKVT